jgi:hypothetical protein
MKNRTGARFSANANHTLSSGTALERTDCLAVDHAASTSRLPYRASLRLCPSPEDALSQCERYAG